ncbi:MAG: chromosomal replication initiator protein [Solirubrobacteraceae bacterium]|nr:chromosomal replication initiator protein [Solirubrobacteraceae bacterium]
MGEAQLLWTACAGVLREQVSEAVWLSSFAEVTPLRTEQDRLVLSVPSPWVKERIESRYLEMVRAALADVGALGLDLDIEVRPDAAELSPAIDDPLDPPRTNGSHLEEPRLDGPSDSGANGRAGTGAPSTPPHERPADSLNPRYTFDAFVIGSSNRFAHAAALTVAERPGLAYNPLFVYGDAGLGKTHLLQAIGHYVHENYRGYRIRYVSSETFLNEFVDSIRTGVGDSFKRRYRGVDLLLVDDIQFFEGKKETLEEFFHTFNALHETGRQVVLSSDRRPDDWPALEDRLRTRFKSGLVTDIQPPDLETRLAILRKKAEAQTNQIPDAVLEYIATHITDNIRELEGALTRVSAFTSLYNEPLSVELAQRVLGDLLSDRQPRVITAERILNATSTMFGLPIDELLSASRTRPLVNARQIAMYVCRVLTDLSFPQIAKAFGKSDHTTVIHAVQKIEKQMGEKRQIFDQVNELTQLIKNTT